MKKITALLVMIILMVSGCSSSDSSDSETLPSEIPPGEKQTFTADGVSFKLNYAPGGSFPTGENDNGGEQSVEAFWIGETELTYELWHKVYQWATTASPVYNFANAGKEGDDGTVGAMPTEANKTEPVTTINWRDAMVWCNAVTEWYNSQSGTSLGCVYKYAGGVIRDSRDSNSSQCDGVTPDASASGFRLLSEWEWEYAARYRGGDSENTVEGYSNPYFTKGNSASGATEASGNNDATFDVAWSLQNGGKTYPSGEKTANTLGLYDMSGNVWEWCFSWYNQNISRVYRGGSWNTNADNYFQIGYRNYRHMSETLQDLGFRLCRTAD